MKKHTGVLVLILSAMSLVACKQTEPEIKAQGVTLDQTTLTLEAGDSLTINANLLPAGATGTTIWSSSNEKVATVVNGKIKTFARGTATIKALVDSTYSATCALTVNKTDLPYQLVWSDEFDGTSLDLTKWNYETGGGGWGNQEKQYYTSRPENIRLENGSLVIEGKKEVYSSNNYTSARINTKNKASFTYGKIEARISLPSGKGTWPAFWMLGYGSWPLCGETDILEHIGSQPTMISHAVHTYEKNGLKGNNWYSRNYLDGIEGTYHVYGIEWEKQANEGDDNISFFVDGVKKATIWEQHVNSTVKMWPFKSDFFIIMNMAIGGTMGGTIDDAIFNTPVLMKVDYVRVYQRK